MDFQDGMAARALNGRERGPAGSAPLPSLYWDEGRSWNLWGWSLMSPSNLYWDEGRSWNLWGWSLMSSPNFHCDEGTSWNRWACGPRKATAASRRSNPLE